MYEELRGDLAAWATHFHFNDETSLLLCKAADAIEELNQIVNHYEEESKGWWLAACEAKEKIQELSKPHWIPVTERLPNCNGCYLVWRPHFYGGEIGKPSICYFDGTNTWHDAYGVDFAMILHPEDVTHWMPLPEPPKRVTIIPADKEDE